LQDQLQEILILIGYFERSGWVNNGMILKYSSLAIAISFGEIGFRVSTSLKGRARGLHSCSECSPQHACIIVDIYVSTRWKKMSHMCTHIYVHAHTLHFVVSPVLSGYNSTADFVHRILYKVLVKENASTFSRMWLMPVSINVD